MLRSTVLLTMAFLFVASPHAEDPVDPTSATADEWLVGQPRAEVLKTLGQPTKVKRGKHGPILVYKFDSPRGFIPLLGLDPAIGTPTESDPHPGERAPEAPAVIATGARQGALKRIEVQLDAEDRVISRKIIYRKKSKIRRESEPE